MAFYLTPEKTHTKQRPQIDIDVPDIQELGVNPAPKFNGASIDDIQRDVSLAKKWVGQLTAQVSKDNESTVYGQVTDCTVKHGRATFLVTNSEDAGGDYHNLVSVANFLLTRRVQDEDRKTNGLKTVQQTAKDVLDMGSRGSGAGKQGPRAELLDMPAKEKRELDDLMQEARDGYLKDRSSRGLSIFEIPEGSLVVELRAQLNESSQFKKMVTQPYFNGVAHECKRQLMHAHGVNLSVEEVVQYGQVGAVSSGGGTNYGR